MLSLASDQLKQTIDSANFSCKHHTTLQQQLHDVMLYAHLYDVAYDRSEIECFPKEALNPIYEKLFSLFCCVRHSDENAKAIRKIISETNTLRMFIILLIPAFIKALKVSCNNKMRNASIEQVYAWEGAVKLRRYIHLKL